MPECRRTSHRSLLVHCCETEARADPRPASIPEQPLEMDAERRTRRPGSGADPGPARAPRAPGCGRLPDPGRSPPFLPSVSFPGFSKPEVWGVRLSLACAGPGGVGCLRAWKQAWAASGAPAPPGSLQAPGKGRAPRERDPVRREGGRGRGRRFCLGPECAQTAAAATLRAGHLPVPQLSERGLRTVGESSQLRVFLCVCPPGIVLVQR